MPTEVTDAITSFSTDAAAYGAAFIGLAVAVSTAKIGIKWVKSFIGRSS